MRLKQQKANEEKEAQAAAAKKWSAISCQLSPLASDLKNNCIIYKCWFCPRYTRKNVRFDTNDIHLLA